MKIDTLPIGLYEENSYVVHDHGHVLLIDPGRFPKEILSHISKEETVDAICLTHGHEDHTGAVDDLVDLLGCPIYISAEDAPLVDSSQYMSYSKPIYHPCTYYSSSSQVIGSFQVKIIPTPGHTEGSVCLQIKNVLFTGDTLFAGDIGRTDLYSGDEAKMRKSLQVLKGFSKDLLVYPGHGPSSTIGQELQCNPYFQ